MGTGHVDKGFSRPYRHSLGDGPTLAVQPVIYGFSLAVSPMVELLW
jgi:hypothetical protein